MNRFTNFHPSMLLYWPGFIYTNKAPQEVLSGACTQRSGLCTRALCRALLRLSVGLRSDCMCCETVRLIAFGALGGVFVGALATGHFRAATAFGVALYFLLAFAKERSKHVLL